GIRTEHAALRDRRGARTAGPGGLDRCRASFGALALLDVARDVRQGRCVRPTRVGGVHQGLRPTAAHAGQDAGPMGRGKRSVARHPEEGAHRAEEGQADQTKEVSEEKPLWSGRFTTGLERRVAGFTSSLELAHRIAVNDVRGNQAHTRMLGRQRILSEKEARTIEDGLTRIVHEIEQRSFPWPTNFEDVHTVIEGRLRDLIGEVAGKLHTGRSRNDQIALDLRLFTIDSLAQLDAAILDLARALVGRAAEEVDTIMPGYTHLQRAQPVSLAHHLLAHVEALRRDRARVAEARERTATSPLGAGALAGAPYPLDPASAAKELGLDRVFRNS